MRETDYAYAVARMRANEGKLLTTAMLDELVAAPSFDRALALLRSHGWAAPNFMSRVFEGHVHNEQCWASRLDVPLRFLLSVKFYISMNFSKRIICFSISIIFF